MVKNLFMKFSCLIFLAVIIINITDKFLMKKTGNVIEKSENVKANNRHNSGNKKY